MPLFPFFVLILNIYDDKSFYFTTPVTPSMLILEVLLCSLEQLHVSIGSFLTVSVACIEHCIMEW